MEDSVGGIVNILPGAVRKGFVWIVAWAALMELELCFNVKAIMFIISIHPGYCI